MICCAETDLFDWLDEYLLVREIAPTTAVTYRSACNSFARWSGSKPSLAETSAGLNQYLLWRSNIGSKQTARGYRSALVALLRAAAESGRVAMPERIRTVTPPAHDPRGFTTAELRKLLTYATPEQAAAIRLVYDTGLRRGDVFRVQWSQLTGNVLRITVGKSGRLHAARLSSDTLAALEAVRTCGRLVPFEGGFTRWRKEWKRLGNRAGVDVDGRGLQTVRRTASSLIAAEHGEHAAAAFLSHSNASGVEIFRKYYAVGEILDKPPPLPPPIDDSAA